jgi:hypothetical protein
MKLFTPKTVNAHWNGRKKILFLSLMLSLFLLPTCSPKLMLSSGNTQIQIDKNLDLRADTKRFKKRKGPVTINWYVDGVKAAEGRSFLFNTPDEGYYKIRAEAVQNSTYAEQEIEVLSTLYDPKLVNLVNGIETFPLEPAKEATLVNTDRKETTEKEKTPQGEKVTVWAEVKETYSASKNPDEFVMYDPNANVLWPGALVQGKSVASGVPDIIPIGPNHRKEGKVTLSVLNGDGSSVKNKFYRATEMTKSATTQAMNDILSGMGGLGPAQYSYTKINVKSESQLEFDLNMGYSGPANKIDGQLGINWNNKKERMVVKLYQKFFTMTYDDPQGIQGVFYPSISYNDMKPYAGAGNPACYISSVTYGRMFVLLYETEMDELFLNAALNYQYDGVVAKGYVEADLKSAFKNGKIEVKTFQVGGDAEKGLEVSLDPLNVSKMRSFIAGGANFSATNPGEIISYTVNYLKDASLVRMNSAMEYTVTQRTPISSDQMIEVPAITNMSKTEADAHLRRLGLKMKVSSTSDDCSQQANTVLSQSPQSGELIKAGSKVSVRTVKEQPKISAKSVPGKGNLHILSPEDSYSQGAWAMASTDVYFSIEGTKCTNASIIISHPLGGGITYTNYKAGDKKKYSKAYGPGKVNIKFVCDDPNARLHLRVW